MSFQKNSQEESSGEGIGVDMLVKEPYTQVPRGDGQKKMDSSAAGNFDKQEVSVQEDTTDARTPISHGPSWPMSCISESSSSGDDDEFFDWQGKISKQLLPVCPSKCPSFFSDWRSSCTPVRWSLMELMSRLTTRLVSSRILPHFEPRRNNRPQQPIVFGRDGRAQQFSIGLAARLDSLLSAQLINNWPVSVPGYHRYPLGDGKSSSLSDFFKTTPPQTGNGILRHQSDGSFFHLSINSLMGTSKQLAAQMSNDSQQPDNNQPSRTCSLLLCRLVPGLRARNGCGKGRPLKSKNIGANHRANDAIVNETITQTIVVK